MVMVMTHHFGKTSIMRLLPLLLVTLLLVPVASVHAWTASPMTQGTSISTPTLPIGLAGYEQVGSVAGSTIVNVVVGVPLKNLGLLESMVKQISTPGSSMFDNFLSAEEVRQLFLPTAQFKETLSYLQESGFNVEFTALDSMIVASATVDQVRQYLGLNTFDYSNGTCSYYSASGSPSVQGVQVYASNVTSVIFAHPSSLVTMQETSSLRQMVAQPNQTAPIESYSPTALQSVYGASTLYDEGYNGSGYTAGILDFFGDPYIAQQLEYFDEVNGLPAPPSFDVEAIGQFNPSLGIAMDGWADEISLDVEALHAMAPGANIILYEANNALPLSVAIASIVQQAAVEDLSQSFGTPESYFSVLGASGLDFNVIYTDEYYMLGSVQGMTFIAGTGDAGGSGYSAGPEGTLIYPSTSPFVTAAGGTTTYIDFNDSTPSSWLQTAWSNYGFVPYGVSYGGGTGGISIYEPEPWYQSSLPAAPAGYADGRRTPDVSLNANVYPGINIVFPGNQTSPAGGTSESSPLLAGLLTLAMQYNGQAVGLINPAIYEIAGNETSYAEAFTPITFGYNIPWVAAPGYNLVTGWGTLRIDGFAHQIQIFSTTPSLSIAVNLLNESGIPTFEFEQGQSVMVSADVSLGILPVTSGSFTATLQTLSGVVNQTSLSYNSSSLSWIGILTVPPEANGLSYVNVEGSSNGLSGAGFSQMFAGYLASYYSPPPILPVSTQFGVEVNVFVSDLDGNQVDSGSFSAVASTYSIESNTYSEVVSVPLTWQGLGHWTGLLNGSYPNGPIMLTMSGGCYGYLPFMNGVDLQPSFILPSVIAEPGCVAPGQSIFVEGELIPPENLPDVISAETGYPLSYDVVYGSNLTAALYGPSGNFVTSDTFWLTPEGFIGGTLEVPSDAQQGLYTIILSSSFNSATINAEVDGSFFAQIYVGPSYNVPSISTNASALFEGETVQVRADIAYQNGTEVKFGMYSATLYPRDLQNNYSLLTQMINVPLFYDSQLNEWVGNATLPSPYNNGGSISLYQGTLYLSGPFEVYVSGISADGVPTTTAMSAQHELYVQPYLYVSDQTISSLEQTSGVAFSDDTITFSSTGSASLTNDVFVDTNTLEGGSLEVTSSQIEGTLQLSNTHVVLIGCVGGDITAQNSTLALMQSSVGSLVLNGTTVSLNSSTYALVDPALPSINVQNPAMGQTYNGTLTVNASVTGQGLSSISLYLDGKLLARFGNTSTSVNYQLDTASISDGVHTLGITANQQDDLSASAYISFSTDSHYILTQNSISNLTDQLNAANTTITSLSSQLSAANTTIGSLSNQLNAANTTITSLSSQLSAANTTIGSLSNQLNAANTTITSLSSRLSNAQTTLNEQGNSTSRLESEATALILGFCGSVVLAVAALIVAIAGVRRKRMGPARGTALVRICRRIALRQPTIVCQGYGCLNGTRARK
jgi:subtilase family serine protease